MGKHAKTHKELCFHLRTTYGGKIMGISQVYNGKIMGV